MGLWLLLPSWLDASKNLPGFRDVAPGPKPNRDTAYFLQAWGFNGPCRYMPL